MLTLPKRLETYSGVTLVFSNHAASILESIAKISEFHVRRCSHVVRPQRRFIIRLDGLTSHSANDEGAHQL